MAPTDYKFEGWLGRNPDSVNGKMEWGDFEPKKWTEDDVDIQVTHCGMCGSDLHTLSSGWGEVPYPCCVGHEIVGKAVRVGSNVKNITLGDRVGVGAQSLSCLQPDCHACSAGEEMTCNNVNVNTYAARYPNDMGISYGGYSNYNRTNGHFVVKIPDQLASEHAAPMLCGGITVYRPLKMNGCGPGKSVAIAGVGGLGHFGILFAKALGADWVTGISRKESKRNEVLSLGADEYIATDDESHWEETHRRKFDLIISTVSSEKMPMNGYLKLLKTKGSLIQVGAPNGGALPPINVFTLLSNEIKLGGSPIGSPGDIREMLDLAVKKSVKPWIELRPLKDANQAILDLKAGRPRFRYVLVNERNA
ncbi:unnamed protein product [Clonostachys rosea f. rosea IK726]|uniref:alcohol dehydrogenase (NADP(+)) n=2 Tax=Bionectria ochroleuca TaxID=29856 RepID=A0A0B7K4A7_BIOOC|nr:unnamed protein product [Clonostachys rosea f. rosea IK726]